MNMETTKGVLTPEGYQKDIEKVKQFVAKEGITWIQAAQETHESLTKDRFMVTRYPTELLLGPDGKIISMDVRGEKLAKLLEKLMEGNKVSAETK
jgi:hypothetical protein